MSTTITQSDLETKFGVSNISVWSDLENDGAANQTRINQCLTVGINRVENAFRMGIYAVPFVAVSGELTMVKDWMLAFAGAWLYFSRGKMDTSIDDRMESLADAAEADMRKYQTGRERLNARRSDSMPSAPVVVG